MNKEVEDKDYIVYRKFSNIMYSTYERLELSKKELKQYIERHKYEIENIEVFHKTEIVKISVDVNVSIEENK